METPSDTAFQVGKVRAARTRANGCPALVSPTNRLTGSGSRQIFYVGNSIKHSGGGGGGGDDDDVRI